jgi:peptidyl-prolyl cis-trans isomerase D
MLALRMLEHKPASTRTLAEVGETIKLKLIHQQALELAVKQGKETLEKLKHGEKLSLVWKAGQSMTRAQLSVQAGELVSQVFQVSAAKLPAYVGVEDTKGGYRLMRVDEIKDVGVVDEAKKARYVQEISKITGEELIRAYLAEAKKHADIKIKPFAVDEK